MTPVLTIPRNDYRRTIVFCGLRGCAAARKMIHEPQSGQVDTALSPMTVIQRPRARLDLLEQFVYVGEESSVGT